MKYNDNSPEVKAVREKLAAQGIYAMYGGRKGHGFWLYQIGVELATRIINSPRFDPALHDLAFGPARLPGVVGRIIPSRIIRNDGSKSGNDHFWMFKDAARYAESQIFCGHTSTTHTIEVFRTHLEPSLEVTPQYVCVTGPFNTLRGAYFYKECSRGNPHVQTSDDADRIAAEINFQTTYVKFQ